MSDEKNNNSREIKIKEQIKFAVVMYGGGSLAIYINGVAQELLRLVQATAGGFYPRRDWLVNDQHVPKTTDIYRRIAFLMSRRKRLNHLSRIENEIVDIVENLKISEEKTENARLQKRLRFLEKRREAINALLSRRVASTEQPDVSFIIDVLTGSSAGGINAVFLSKALVNGVDGIDHLQQLWIEQGDFAKLLNDKKSVADNQLDFDARPASLLNSQRMYLELLKALDGMKEKTDTTKRMVEELDLYVTFTDFRGVPLPIFLSDKSVVERSHKQVFNFRYNIDGINDFNDANNPFLAFAARTTSAFPLAFEPSRLIDIDDVLKNAMPDYEAGNSDNPDWSKYFSDLTDENYKPVEWKTRSFVDGGALDNKPFGYAVDKLTQRTTNGIVHRKLLYIEPAPEDFTPQKNSTSKPNAIANLIAQASGLPMYETIREDLQRLIDRNRLIRRMKRITNDVERDFDINFKKLQDTEIKPGFDWTEAGLDDVINFKGIAFLPYYRLRISALTDDIAKLITGYFRIDANSDYFEVIRSLISVWRNDNFWEYRNGKSGADKAGKIGSFNNFLYLYDVEYRFRRLQFIMQKIENLLHSPEQLLDDVLEYALRKTPETAKKNGEPASGAIKKTSADAAQERMDGFVTPAAALFDALPGANITEKIEAVKDLTKNPEKLLRQAREIQSQVNGIYIALRREHEYLHTALKNPKFAESILESVKSSSSGLHDPAETQQNADNEKRRVKKFQEKLAEVEIKLQSLEIDKRIEKYGKNEQTRVLQKILEKQKRISAIKAEDATTKEELSQEEYVILKKLSFATLERILRRLRAKGGGHHGGEQKKTERGETGAESGRGGGEKKIKCGETGAESGVVALEDIYGQTGVEDIIGVIKETAEVLSEIYNPVDSVPGFTRRASDDMREVLEIKDKNASPGFAENEENMRSGREENYGDSIRKYLKNYYSLFDSYDQISFPAYYETSVGEAVEVDIVRISSRDAHSLINEEDTNEKRRKLAGDLLYAFGAFLDPRWRLNDIMWGRLDGSERLIQTLLPEREHENLRNSLIREANSIIINEMLLSSASKEFRGIAVDSLTLASTEAIARNAVDRLVKKLTAKKIQTGLNSALTSALEKEAVYEQVRANYEVNRSPEPEPTMRILSRATQVTGKILEGIADQSGLDGSRIGWIAKLGQIFWGLVTVAVPNSLANLIVNYWLQLLYMFEVVVIVGSTILINQTVQQFGIAALLITVSFNLAVLALQDMIRGDSFLDLIKYFFFIVIIACAGLGFFFFYALTFGGGDLWKDIAFFQNKISGYGLWQKAFALIVPGILLIALLSWRELTGRFIKSFGSGILALTILLLVSGAVMMSAVKNLPQTPPPIIALEFADTLPEFNALLNETGVIMAQNRADLKTALFIDSFIFIPLYVCVFLLLAQLLAFRRRGWFGRKTILFLIKPKADKKKKALRMTDKNAAPDSADAAEMNDLEMIYDPLPEFLKGVYFKLFRTNAVWLALIAFVLVLGAGIADAVENYYSYQALNALSVELDAHLWWLTLKTNAAQIKFLLTFAAVSVISANFYRRYNGGYTNEALVGFMIILWIMSILGAVFTLFEIYRPCINPLLTAQIAATFIIAFILIRMNKTFLKDF